jgi:hypothetical protein
MQPHRSNALDGAAAALSFDSGTHARVLWPVHHRPQTTVMVLWSWSHGLVHAWVGQIVTFFAYRPPSRPLGSLTPTQPGRVTNPTQGHPGPPWEAPQAECRSLRREPKPPA